MSKLKTLEPSIKNTRALGAKHSASRGQTLERNGSNTRVFFPHALQASVEGFEDTVLEAQYFRFAASIFTMKSHILPPQKFRYFSYYYLIFQHKNNNFRGF